MLLVIKKRSKLYQIILNQVLEISNLHLETPCFKIAFL
jgi:hypothetical protein